MNKLIYLLTIIVLLSSSNIKGQSSDLKYKDIFEVVKFGPEKKAYELLIQYQHQDPFLPNTYYQLGLIAQKWASELDPLTEYSDLKYFSFHANLYFTLAKGKFDEKDARKNNEYYHLVKPIEGEKKASYEQIFASMEQKLKEVSHFDEEIHAIRSNYFGTVRNYNKSLQLFKSIVDKNGKLKNIYLTADAKLIEDINNIGIHFDSTLQYFDAYKKSIQSHPIPPYNQNFEKATIETYRLDGLTKSNFLNNEIDLWDYRQWSNDVMEVINNDINQLRIDIETEGKKIESLLNLMNISNDYSDSYDYYALDEKLAFRIGRFDFNPLVLDIFNYKISKLNLIISSKKTINDPNNINDSTQNYNKRLTFYRDLVNRKLTSDNYLNACNQHFSDFNILKYQDYIFETFRNQKGFEGYLKSEPKKADNILDKSFENLKKQAAIHRRNMQTNPNFIQVKNDTIPLNIQKDKFAGNEPKTYYTTKLAEAENGTLYATGYVNLNNKNSKAFIASCDSTYNLNWIKHIDCSPNKKHTINNYGAELDLTDDGCILIVHTRDTLNQQTTIKNWVVRYNTEGKETQRDSTGVNLIPQLMSFDDINQKMLATYKGIGFNDFNSKTDSLFIVSSDSAGQTIWSTPIEFNGEVVNVIRSNENTILVANYSELMYQNKQYTLPKNNTNAFLAIIDNIGQLSSLKQYNEDFAYYLSHAVKLDSETINLLGFKTNDYDLNATIFNSDIKLQYLLVDTKGNIKYKY